MDEVGILKNFFGLRGLGFGILAMTLGAATLPAQVDEPSNDGAVIEDASALSSSREIDLSSLKDRFQNAVVKVEFTALRNKELTKLNPSKSEQYYSGDEPPHGSGFFISESEILTNAHVVEEARRGSIRIKTPATGNVEFRAEVLGVGGTEQIDLAVLRLPDDEVLRLKRRSGLKRIPTLTLGDSDQIHQADPVAIFGYPQNSDELKIIAAKVTGRQYLKIKTGEFICQHQFIEVGPGGVVQSGNSGGPGLNRAGKVVGIPARGSGYGSEQGWLIPSNVVSHFLKRVRENESGRKDMELPKLGISVTENFTGNLVWADATEDVVMFELGVMVREVTSGSLASRWGLKAGDILVGFANRQQDISCALDMQGYRVTTGRMSVWPPVDGADSSTVTDAADQTSSTREVNKLHLTELVLLSQPGDDVTLWYVRQGTKGIQKVERKFEFVKPVPLAHLGTFEKPDYELWGDFVAQDFNDFNAALFEVPDREILQGGALVTFVEPNSLASRRGMSVSSRDTYGFSWTTSYEPATTWAIIDSVNDKPVKSLKELREALRAAEKAYADLTKKDSFDASRRSLMKERYVQIGFRTNSNDGQTLRLQPAFPIDEALEVSRKED
jgi:S1-C subfamily serine protease